MTDKLGFFLNAACDWAERNDIPTEIWRSEMSEWYVTLRFKDALGWFSMSLGYFDQHGKNNGKAAETEDEYRDRIHQKLSKTAQKARADRIKQNNKVSKLPAKAA